MHGTCSGSCTILLSGLREASTAGSPTAVTHSSILVLGFVRRRTAHVGDRGEATLQLASAARPQRGRSIPLVEAGIDLLFLLL